MPFCATARVGLSLFQFDAKKLNPDPPPALPETWGSNPPSLLSALDAAMKIAPANATRFAIDCVQLRPSEGRIAATDARQLLTQSGFTFPWTADVLIRRSPVFRCRELTSDQPIETGVTANHFVVRTGPWTIWLALEKQGRFPDFKDVIPAAGSAKTRLRIAEDDAVYLLNVIPRLPLEEPDNPRLSVDLNGSVALLARGAEPSSVTQVTLSNSQRVGDEVRLDTDREFLIHAVQLGFREIELRGPESPAVCRDATRIYLWSLIAEQPAIVVGTDTVRLASPLSTSPSHRPARHLPPPRRLHHPNQERTPSQMPRNRIAETLAGASPSEPSHAHVSDADAGHAEDESKHSSFNAVLQQAESVKTALRQAHTQVNELVVALKRHRRQSKLMQTTLASLRQLQTLDV